MRSLRIAIVALALAASGTLGWSQVPAVRPDVVVNPDGSVTLKNTVVPLPSLLSEGGRNVLMRARPTEGPGAPVPVPAGIADMAEVRRVYNDDLKPNVDHMRGVFPVDIVDIEETTIAGVSVAMVTSRGGVPEKNRESSLPQWTRRREDLLKVWDHCSWVAPRAGP